MSRRTSRSRRNRGHEEHQTVSHERWLITYADLITLLLIFFIILYAMSQIDLSKFERISLSLSTAIPTNDRIQIESPPEPGQAPEPIKEEDADKAKQEQMQLDDLKKQIEAYIQSNNLQGKVNVLDTERGVQITLNDAALFQSGEAELKQEARNILGGMTPFLKLVGNEIEVEGHTDNVPIKTTKFPSNWELSAQRAINVLHFFESMSLPSERMHAVGYAHTQPLAVNDSDVHRAANRRVNLIIERKYPMGNISPI